MPGPAVPTSRRQVKNRGRTRRPDASVVNVVEVTVFMAMLPAYSGNTPGAFLGHRAMTAGSTLSVWATISGGVWLTQLDTETAWYCHGLNTAGNSRARSPVLRM